MTDQTAYTDPATDQPLTIGNLDAAKQAFAGAVHRAGITIDALVNLTGTIDEHLFDVNRGIAELRARRVDINRMIKQLVAYQAMLESQSRAAQRTAERLDEIDADPDDGDGES
jgi:hypothetical protein